MRHRHAVHSLTWIDRGSSHVHRWQARCVCGWWSMSGRRKTVEGMYRVHLNQKPRPAGAVPRPLTPLDQLPELLRA